MPRFIEKIFIKLLSPVLEILFYLLKWEHRKYSLLCRRSCILETWIRIADGKPIDFDSKLYEEISSAIHHYLFVSAMSKTSFDWLERTVLPLEYAYWLNRNEFLLEAPTHYKFVLKHRVADIIKKHVSVYLLINTRVTQSICVLEQSAGKTCSTAYWKNAVSERDLPSLLQPSAETKEIRNYLNRKITVFRKKLAQKNTLKLDLNPSDYAGFISISGTLLFVMGYVHVAIVNKYFDIPYQQFYSISDYLSSSVNRIDTYFLTSVMTVIFFAMQYAKSDTIYYKPAILKRSKTEFWLEKFPLHLIGIMSIIIAVF